MMVYYVVSFVCLWGWKSVLVCGGGGVYGYFLFWCYFNYIFVNIFVKLFFFFDFYDVLVRFLLFY